MNFILNFLFPHKCAICGELTNSYICKKCLKSAFHYYGENKQLNIPNYLALFKYNKSMQKLVALLKYRKNPRVLALLQKELIKHAPKFENIDMIIPVPVNPIRLKERGFNQTEELIKPLANFYKIPLCLDIIFHKQNTKKFSALSRLNRSVEAQKAFDIWDVKKSEIAGKNILLFDDIITTGTTMRNILRILNEFKPASVFCLALARPELKHE